MVVTLAEAKTHLRIQHNEEDDYITSLIVMAEAAASDFCHDDYSVATNPPEPVRLAVLLMISYYYENRDMPDQVTYKAMRMAFENLLYPHRVPELMF